MNVLTKQFDRLARRYGLSDDDLRRSLDEAARGLIEADLGLRLIKQRVARSGKGKSGGFRLILYYRRGERAVFLHVFAKNERDNLDPSELDGYRDLGRTLDGLIDDQITALIERRGWRMLDDAGPDKDLSQ